MAAAQARAGVLLPRLRSKGRLRPPVMVQHQLRRPAAGTTLQVQLQGGAPQPGSPSPGPGLCRISRPHLQPRQPPCQARTAAWMQSLRTLGCSRLTIHQQRKRVTVPVPLGAPASPRCVRLQHTASPATPPCRSCWRASAGCRPCCLVSCCPSVCGILPLGEHAPLRGQPCGDILSGLVIMPTHSCMTVSAMNPATLPWRAPATAMFQVTNDKSAVLTRAHNNRCRRAVGAAQQPRRGVV